MKHINNRKKSGLGVCLLISQLLTFHGAWAQTTVQKDSDNSAQFQNVYHQNRVKKQKPKMLVLNQPDAGVVQLSASLGYGGGNYSWNTRNIYNQTAPAKVDTKMTGYSSQISAAYGFTDNFYSRLNLSFSDSKRTQTMSNVNNPFAQQESVGISSGISEPDVIIGAQGYFGPTQLFAELSMDVPLGDSVVKRTGYNEATDNNLKGGMSYTSSAGLVFNFGSVLLMGGASYTINDERTQKSEDQGLTSTKKFKGGNIINAVTGIEFKELSRLGFVLGYQKTEDLDEINKTTYQTLTSSGVSELVASTSLGIKIGSNTHLIPKISYIKVLDDKKTFSNGTLVDISQADSWNLNLGARVNF